MKTVRLFVLIAIFSSIIFSCNHGFLKDPRLYNPKKTQQGGMSAAEEPELVQTGGVDPFDDIEKWYNKSDSNGDDTNPEKGGFPHTDFATMSLVGTYFNGDNVPVYAMKQENVWVSNDASKGEFVHAKAPDTTGQGYSISNVYWYQYQGKNPVYAADGNYNQSLQVTAANNPKLSRFYFYRFTGDTLSPSLDNFLFAVDTYSKLMFAFAYPTKTEAVFGNNVPKAWGPIDGNAFLGTNYQFYMYDPVGYVEKKDDGGYKVVLYQWFQNNLAKGVYQPTLGGIDAESQGDAYVELARKSPDGAGKSPFNNQSVDFFAENMKLLRGAVFYRREQLADGGNGLVLYKYTVDGEATKITRTAESWRGLPTDTSLEPVDYTIGEGKNATSGSLKLGDKELTFELSDETRCITITGEDHTTEVAVKNFTDLGPEFIERVKNDPFYKSTDGKITYEFKDNGKTLIFTNDGKTYNYTYVEPRNDEDKNCAVYSSEDALLAYAGFELTENDTIIKASRTSGAWTETFAWDMTHAANLTYKMGTTFQESVAGKSFSYRGKNDVGYDLALRTLEFSADGISAKLYETKWGSVAELIKENLTVTDGSSATDGMLAEQAVSITITGEGQWKLVYEGNTYYIGYNDPGPSFVNRVQDNPTFVSQDEKTIYRFSNYGRTLRMSYSGGWLGIGSFDYTYHYVQEADSDRSSVSYAVYKAENGIAGFSFAGFELSNSDMQIRATNTSAAGANLVDWLIMTYDAMRTGNTGSVPTEEDLETFYTFMKGKTFKTRNAENDAPGLELLTWQIDDTGKAGSLKKQIWLSNSETIEVTIPEGKLVALDKNRGTFLDDKSEIRYDFSYDEDVGTFLVKKSGRAIATSTLTYSVNYEDKGPGFVNRVKGKTYRKYAANGQLETEYKFSADGTQLDLIYTTSLSSYGGKKGTYTYAPDKDKGSVGNYVYAVYGNYYVDLTDGNNGEKDAVVRMENTTAASDYWAADMEYEAYLVDGNDVGGTGQGTTTPPSSTEPAPSPEVEITFQSQVQGKKFSYRKSNTKGYDLSLMTLEFGSDGTSATLTETKWKVTDAISTSTLAVTNGSGTKDGKIGEKPATISTSEKGMLQVEYDGNTYVYGYTDPTPSFVNRVQDNPTFVSSDGATVYRFSNFGETMRMTWSGGDYTYTFDTEVASGDTCRAVYKTDDAWWGFPAAGFELSNSDNVIKATHESAAGASAVVWNLTYEATRNGDSSKAPTPEDLDAFYKSLQGKTFKVRNVENEVAGLELLTWTFDSNRGATLTKEVWGSASSSEPEASGGLSAQSKTTGFFKKDNTVYKFSYDEGAQKLRVESNGTSYDFMANYDDKGPGFINRVKGSVYKGSGYTYVFSDDGKTIKLSNGKTYTYAQQDDNLRAVYKQQDAVFWGLRLDDNDNTLYFSGTSGGWPETTATDGVSSSPAWRILAKGRNFHETVANKKWQIREDDSNYGGKELGQKLLTWEFSSDGQTATMYEDVWRGDGAKSTISVAITSTSPTTGTGSEGYTFSLSSDLMTLTVKKGSESGKQYKFDYEDKGPHFLWRVAGAEFKGTYDYIFSEDGTTLKWYGKDYIYQEEDGYEGNTRNALYGGYRIGFYGEDDEALSYKNWANVTTDNAIRQPEQNR